MLANERPSLSVGSAVPERTLAGPQDAYTAWEWQFDDAYRHGGARILNMHPHTTGRHGRLVALERLVRCMKSHEHVQFMRCIDVAEGWTEQGLRE